MAAESTTSRQFEFPAEHNRHFGAAGYWMGIMGRLGVLFGVLACMLALFRCVAFITVGVPAEFAVREISVSGLIIGFVSILCSIWTMRAAAAFRQVDTSTGRDIDHVMLAVGNLVNLYRLQAILIGTAAGLLILTGVWYFYALGREDLARDRAGPPPAAPATQTTE